MALELLIGATAGAVSKELDVRSVGTRMVPFRIYVIGNNSTVTILGSPTNQGTNYITLGTVAAGGGSLLIEEPIDYLQVTLDNAENGSVNVFISTSR